MELSDFTAQRLIRRIEETATEEEFRRRVDGITPYSLRHPEVYAAVLRKSRQLKQNKK